MRFEFPTLSRYAVSDLKGESVSKKYSKSEAGFTLIELMVVMVVLATITVFIVPKFMDAPKQAKRVKAQVTIATLLSLIHI